MTNKQRIKKLQKQNGSLRQRLGEVYGKLLASNHMVSKQIAFIGELNKQLLQQDKAIECKDEELKVLKSMYRDDLINNFRE